MTVHELRDELNRICEEGFGEFPLVDGFNIWDYIGDLIER